MLFKVEETSLLIKENIDAAPLVCRMGDFSVSSIDVDFACQDIYISAIAKNSQFPDPFVGSPTGGSWGDIYLYKYDAESEKFDQIYKKYANNVQLFPDGSKLAIHEGNGLTILNADGSIFRKKWSLGKFNYGRPNIKVSPSGKRVAIIKWKGDREVIAVLDLEKDIGEVFKVSCYSYDWYDSNTIVYSTMRGLKFLDVITQESTKFLYNRNDILKIGKDEISQGGIELLKNKDVRIDIDQPKKSGSRVYFRLDLFLHGSESSLYEQFSSVNSIDRQSGKFIEHFKSQKSYNKEELQTEERVRITDYAVVGQETVFIKQEYSRESRIFKRTIEQVGGVPLDGYSPYMPDEDSNKTEVVPT